MNEHHVESADGTLVVIVVRAKHLPNRRKFDKQLPYATLRIGTVAKKTPSAFRAGQTPDWTHEVRFDLLVERKPILVVDVLDETKNDPTMIGHCEIDCLKVFNHSNYHDGKYILDGWYELLFNEKRAGLIYLEMTFYPLVPIVPPKVPVESAPTAPLPPHHYLEAAVHDHIEDTSDQSSMGLRPSLEFGVSHSLRPPIPPKDVPPPLPTHSIRSSAVESPDHSNSPRRSPIRRSPHNSLLPHSSLPSQNSHHSHPPPPVHHSQLAQDTPRPRISQRLSQTSDLLRSPPKHPHRKSNSAVDEVFVLGNYKPPGLAEKLKKFATQRPPPSPTVVTLNEEDIDKKGGLKNRISKFVSKYETKNGVSTLWNHSPSERARTVESGPYFRSPLPMSEYESEINFAPESAVDGDVPQPPPHTLVLGKRPLESGLMRYLPSSELSKLFSRLLTAVPFSADLIGLEDEPEDLPTQVFCMNQQVRLLSHAHHPQLEKPIVAADADEIDPKYYAPQPTEQLNQQFRISEGHATDRDLAVDLRTHKTGYIGNGKFLPSVFDRALHAGFEDDPKPPVPPKIPYGLSEKEYYTIDRQLYIKDISGNRY